jgi:hypothetical protein
MGSITDVYGAFIDYYGDISLKKIKSENGYDVYATRVSSGLSLFRYIFVISESNNNNSVTALDGETKTLNSINWISFQTRTTDENHNVPTITLMPSTTRNEKLSDIVRSTERTTNDTKYICDSLPIVLSLIHDLKKKNVYQYPDACKLYQALETFNSVVEIL